MLIFFRGGGREGGREGGRRRYAEGKSKCTKRKITKRKEEKHAVEDRRERCWVGVCG
jgi:hypothetical protein